MTTPQLTPAANWRLRQLCPPKVDPYLTERVHRQAKHIAQMRDSKEISADDVDKAFEQLEAAG